MRDDFFRILDLTSLDYCLFCLHIKLILLKDPKSKRFKIKSAFHIRTRRLLRARIPSESENGMSHNCHIALLCVYLFKYKLLCIKSCC